MLFVIGIMLCVVSKRMSIDVISPESLDLGLLLCKKNVSDVACKIHYGCELCL